MDVLKDLLNKIYRITFVLTLFLNTGCQLGYFMKSAYNQLSLLSSREPIDKAIQSDKLTDKEKGKLLLAEKAKIFAEEKLHLTKSKNYSSFAQLDRPYVTYVVSAAPKWQLKHYIFSYPIVGDMPYKGFFNEKDAIEEETELKQMNLDTYRRGVSAYSTLGWFNDPVLSSMLTYSDHDLVNTIIHESVHATLYIKNSADFNERLAVFLGNKGTELYYLETEGADSKTIKLIKEENEDDLIFSKFISQKIIDLEMWYKNNKSIDESLRTEQFDKIDPDRWHENFLSRIDSAADPMPIFRHFGEEKHLVYKKTGDIDPEEQERFINKVRLPDNKTGEFKKDVFDKAVATVIDTWSRLFIDVVNKDPDGVTAYIKNWNLDTGIDEEKAYFWT